MKQTTVARKPLSGLPGAYGGGSFSQEAYRYVDWLQENGYTCWKPFPARQKDACCPIAVYAGDPRCIDLSELIACGFLRKEECDYMYAGERKGSIEYLQWMFCRNILLMMAYERTDLKNDPEYEAFVEENQWWLKDFAMLMARKSTGDVLWQEGDISERLKRELVFDIEFQMYLQFQFFRQYAKLKAYATQKGVELIWSMPLNHETNHQ